MKSAETRGGTVAPRILIVEDNPQNRYLLTFLLEKNGYELQVAEDAELGLKMLEEAEPDVILMDMQLPKIDGYEATRRIKADERFRNIPLVALTAHSMRGDRIRAIEAGCDEFVTKPVDADGLLELLKRLTGS
ncbi:MAG: response regulator [Coriobacteriia bacterium]|nr:response regulator [Coriobacteriia bacterium]